MNLLNHSTQLRSYFVKALIGSLVVAAGAGIFTLLFGTFDTVQARILLTTLLIGVYSIISLCCMTVFGGRFGVWGLAGILVTSLSLMLGLSAVWVEWGSNWEVVEQVLRYFAVLGILGISIGHQSLLLRIIDRTAATTKMLIFGTVGVIGLVAAMLVLPLLLEDFDLGDVYWRLLGVLAILDVLGSIVTPVIARTNRGASK